MSVELCRGIVAVMTNGFDALQISSNTQVVIKTGFDRLASYFNSGNVPACREFVVDGTLGTTPGVPTGC